jgi:hypothetical protein
MKQTITSGEPKLGRPGAGLPWVELQVARRMVGWQSRRSTRESAAAQIRTQLAAITELAGRCDAAQGTARVLIRRLPGMEDSSRYWSVFMTVEHLHIVNAFMAETIASLGRGEVPPRVADTAAVKPGVEAGPESLALLAESCDAIERATGAIPDLHTQLRHAHPWFGPMDAAGWHFMAGFHMRLHHAQIQAIMRGHGGHWQ